ncbi:ribosome biogenesis GTPase Der [Candidatus Uhrbacteria bacterium]|nr:ribosome biogenesis GTPase Der [Candidatus Uhrbacteria bacterium]
MRRSKNFPVVAIVGRANVGKSTLWNRLTETTRALVSDIPHTTRDRNYGVVTWRGLGIEAVDTGGLDADQGSEIGRGILRQAEHAIREADLVLFLVDADAGVLGTDRDLAKNVRALNPHILLVANKIDDPRKMSLSATKEVFGLGLGEAIAVSASTGRGIGDLLDLIYEDLERRGRPPQPLRTDEGLKLVIMGRPNVGKSSLMNAILGEERVIVSSTPHTTREPQDTSFDWKGEHVTLIDTAGMRKRSKVEAGLEKAGIGRNEQALMRADVALLVFDVTEDVTTQDRHLAGLLQDAGRGLILIANKWDLVEDKQTGTAAEFEELIRQTFPFLSWAPVVFVSAKNRLRTDKLLELAFQIREERRRQIAYNALQRFLKTVVARKKPLPAAGPKSPYIFDATQIGIEPPSFLITVRGEKESVHTSWLRYFENRLREKFGFDGTPIVVKAKNRPFSKLPDESRRISAGPKKKAKHPWARKRRAIGRKGGRY